MSDFQPRFRQREELPTFVPPGIHGPGPQTLTQTRHHQNVLYVAGFGPKPAKVMFIMTALSEDDARETMGSSLGEYQIKQKPRYLKGQAGGLFKNLLEECGLPVKEQYFTAICKWLLPKDRRAHPKTTDIEWGRQLIEDEIAEVNPDIIVCLGKPVFDFLFDIKLKLREIEGGWFHSKKFNCRIYPMDNIERPVMKPEYLEKFRVDLIEVRKMLALCNGVAVAKVETEYTTIRSASELQWLTNKIITEGHKILSVDCEWHGQHHVDGKLRSMQLCWAPGKVAYIRFMDDALNYVFDVSYTEAGKIIGIALNLPDRKYVGHQYAADAPWLHCTLGLIVYRKCCWDTLYAMQCIDENAEVKLERLAVAFTDLGRYDIDLTIWKKMNPKLVEDGYGLVPDDILILYAQRDADATYRIYLLQQEMMAKQGQGLVHYYQTLFLPFATDIFTSFTVTGLPMDIARLSKLRDLFLAAKTKLNELFVARIMEEAQHLLLNACMKLGPATGVTLFQAVRTAAQAGDHDKALSLFKDAVPVDKMATMMPVYEHFIEAPRFNIRSTAHMKRWLFQVKGHIPIKSTNNKEKGLPSMAWDRVMRLPPATQATISPSTDKQTLKVLSEKDPILKELLELNAVGNLAKGFLKPAELDDEGNVVRENGLHYWIGKDGRIHGQWAATDTGRSRSWSPNSLNWPSWVNEQICNGIARVIEAEPVGSYLYETLNALTGLARDKETGKLLPPPSIRSCVNAAAIPPKDADPSSVMCLVEADYKTAEVLGLAYISGDKNLIRLMTEDDKQFAYLKDGKTTVRLNYAEDYLIAKEHQEPAFLMAVTKAGKVLRQVLVDELLLTPEGVYQHPKHDLHWNLAEMITKKPREKLRKKQERDGVGKVGNFKSSYGAGEDSMERAVEAETGIKPEPGMGKSILDTLAARQPVADAFLKAQELVPDSPGFMVAQSGRIRHFYVHDRNAEVNRRTREQVVNGLGRIARNFYMQESVAATSSKAGLWLTEYFLSRGMEARVIAILYDSVVTLCPLRERHAVAVLYDLFMYRINTWHYHGRELNYPIDTEFNWAWSERPSKEDQKKLDDPAYLTDEVLLARVKMESEAMIKVGQPFLISTTTFPCRLPKAA